MDMSHFNNIRVVLAEPNTVLRKTLKDCLLEHGFQSVLDTGNLSQVTSAVREGHVDLLIADTSLPEGDFNAYVRELRHGKHGKNPFLVVISLLNHANTNTVQAAMNSGTDHVLAKPFEPLDMIKQAMELTHGRKKFVVTTDYIGPDRRSRKRTDGMQIERIVVPNALRQRMTGQMSESALHRAISASREKINEQKVVRHAYQIGWLLERISPEIGTVPHSAAYEENLVRLGHVAEDISQRMRSTRYAHMVEICLTLSSMVSFALKKGFVENDVQILSKISAVLKAGFDPERDAHMEILYRNRGASSIPPHETFDKRGAQVAVASV